MFLIFCGAVVIGAWVYVKFARPRIAARWPLEFEKIAAVETWLWEKSRTILVARLYWVGGAVIGLIFPPALLASAAVGAGVGAGAGALVSHGQKAEIKADVEDTLPLNSSGIVAIFEEEWEGDIDKALSNASNVTKEKVDKGSADKVKAAASKS